MRRWLAVAMMVAVVGSSACREMFQARPDVVATAGGQTLRADRVGSLMATIKGVPMSREAAEFLTNLWVDHTLFAQALAAGRDLADSATATAVLWPELVELRANRYHDSLIARRIPITPAVADSIYGTDEIRLLQHVLIRVEPNAEPPVRDAAHRKAAATLARLKGGANFAKVAMDVSDDPGSKLEGGYLSPSPRGKFVTAFDSAGWSLSPGAMTGLVETPFGFHIIRRPPPSEVRDRLLAYARDRVGLTLDSMYLDSLATARNLKVDGGAAAAMRDAVAAYEKAVRSQKVLARYEGGQVTVADLMRWAAALPPNWSSQIAQQPDSALTKFIHIIGQNQLLVEEAQAIGIGPTPAEWASMVQRYRAQLDTLRLTFSLTGADVSDPTASASVRAQAAVMKVDAFWDRLAEGAGRPRPIPPQLAYVLRQTADVTISPAGVARAVEVAQQLRAAKDSTTSAPTARPDSTQKPPVAGPGR